MKSFLKYLLIIISFILITLTVITGGSGYYLAHQINKNFASQDIDLSSIFKDKYVVRFKKITPTGLPFNLAFRVDGYEEDNLDGNIIFKCPIFIGYNFNESNLYLNFKGEITGFFKPLQSGFGVKVITEESGIKVFMPFNTKLYNIIKESNLFELINYVKKIHNYASNMQVYDLINNEKIYHQEKLTTTFTFPEHDYYYNYEELINNIPREINIENELKVTESAVGRRILPTNLLLGLKPPLKIYLKNKVLLKTTKQNWEQAKSNFTIIAEQVDSSSEIHDAKLNFTYGYETQGQSNDISLKLASIIKIKEGFSESFNSLMKSLSNIANLGPDTGGIKQYFSLLEKIYLNNEKNNLKLLENKEYDAQADIRINNNLNKIISDIKNLSLRSGNTGFKLEGVYNINTMFSPYINTESIFSGQGSLSVYNYPFLSEFVASIIAPLRLLVGMNLTEYDVISKGVISTMELISDNPKLLSSKDINLKINFDKNILKKKEIGTIDVDQLYRLFKIEVYRAILNKMENSSDKQQILKEISSIITYDESTMLEKLSIAPGSIDMNTVIDNLK